MQHVSDPKFDMVRHCRFRGICRHVAKKICTSPFDFEGFLFVLVMHVLIAGDLENGIFSRNSLRTRQTLKQTRSKMISVRQKEREEFQLLETDK